MKEKFGLKKIEDGVYEGRKVVEMLDFKSETDESGDLFVSGYVNTKNKPDAYGDIPFGDNVYDLKRYAKNPVLLIDHNNSAAAIAGKSVLQQEDKTGFFSKFLMMKNPQTEIAKHVIEAVKEKLLRAFSIGGIWKFEDETNRQHLTKAVIHEVSLVAIGADPRALASSIGSKAIVETNKGRMSEFVAHLISEYRKTEDQKIIELIHAIKGQNNG